MTQKWLKNPTVNTPIALLIMLMNSQRADSMEQFGLVIVITKSLSVKGHNVEGNQKGFKLSLYFGTRKTPSALQILTTAFAIMPALLLAQAALNG